MLDYAKLRLSALTESIAILRNDRPPVDESAIDKHRGWLMGAALLRFNFIHGDLVRWLGGEYTNAFRDWEEAFEVVDSVRHHPVPPGYPPLDFDRAYRACNEGIPLAGIFECSMSSTWNRERYDNHSTLAPEYDAVREKLRVEEKNSFYILLPRFLCYFLFGLHLSPLSFIWRKGKGRACVDNSSRIGKADDGAPNDSIPAPGSTGHDDECPAVHYASALQRHLVWIWNLRISHPNEDILQFGDDVHAAFHRMLYHPDLAIVFAFVFMEFLCIPVGSVFGARNSPSWWCLLAEVRAHLAACGDFADTTPLLADRVRLVLPPTPREEAQLVAAISDRCHTGVPDIQLDRYHQSMFVDDSAQAELRHNIRASIHHSEQSAYTILGHPGVNRRASCLSAEKWRDTASYVMEFLGFEICTRSMTVRWPVPKRLALKAYIEEKWLARPCRVHPREIASLLGTVRNAAFVAPLGNHLSIRVQQCLNEAIAHQGHHRVSRRWWSTHLVTIPDAALDDIQTIYRSLDDNESHPIWQSYIGYLVPREPTTRIISDAAYEGIGGWSPEYSFKWRLNRDDLVHTGFDMKFLADASIEPSVDASGLHINVLEFVAIIINLWLVIVLSRRHPVPVGGHVFAVFADNTSALSWLRYASRSHRPNVCRLARFTSALLFASGFQGRVQGRHLSGRLNRGADALSRCRTYPTWASVTEQCSLLSTCTTFRLPHELLSTLGSLSSDKPIGAAFEEVMIRLLSLEPATLRTGYNDSGTTTSRSKPSRKGKRSH
jgi:hypothetical protein